MTIKADDALREEGLAILKKLNEPLAPSLSIMLEALVVAEKRGMKKERERVWDALNKVRNSFIKAQGEYAHDKEMFLLYKNSTWAVESVINHIAPLVQGRSSTDERCETFESTKKSGQR